MAYGMLDRAHKLKAVRYASFVNVSLLLCNVISQPVNLFILSADQLYGPITTLRRESSRDGRIIKNIPWTAFALDELDWARVLDVKMILTERSIDYIPSFRLIGYY